MNRLMTANFQGAEILGVELDGEVYIVLKPLVEAIGLAWNGQLERIKRDPVLREGMRMVRIPSLRGGNQDTVTLRLDRLHGWLFTINSGHTRPEIQERVQAFQRECHDVLHRHFCGNRDRALREQNETLSLNLRLCTESRQIHGLRAAAELWIKLGLPTVPAMEVVLKQGELFEMLDEMKKAA